MDDTLQTNIFVNGSWTTETRSIHSILAANSGRQQSRPSAEPNRAADLPTYGILTRRVIGSPAVNWIVPGRIRNGLKNDLLFIGEDFVHIKEIAAGGHIRHIGSKSDFGSTIRAAKVLGKAIRRRRGPDGIKVEDDDSRSSTGPDDTPPAIKREESGSPSQTNSLPTVPPQILVLAMESNDLIFMFAHQPPGGDISFLTCTLPLPAERSFLEQPGKHLAIDPYSRAVAVGAHQGTVMLYGTKSMNELKRQFYENGGEWSPFTDECMVKIPGNILKMDFLYPEADVPDHVILLVVYRSHEQRPKIFWKYLYWDNKIGLKEVREGGQFPLGQSKMLSFLPCHTKN